MTARAPLGADRGDETEALPAFPFRHRIIPVLHEVVPARFGLEAPSLGSFYAAVAVLALNEALRLTADGYTHQAGRVHVRVRGSAEIVMGATGEGAPGLSFHAWAGRRHPSGRVEVVDLATRHFGTWAPACGPDHAAGFPRAVWGWADDLPKAFRYVPDEAGSASLRAAFWSAHEAEVADAAREVLVRISVDAG